MFFFGRVSSNETSGLFFQSFIFVASETPPKTYCIFSQFLCCLILRPVVNLDAWKKQQNFSQMVVFHGDEPHGRKQRITPKTNPTNCSENP